MGICITFLVFLLGFTSWGDTSCEAYKQQVLNDCSAMQTTINTLTGRSGDIWKIHQAALNWSSHSLNIGDSSYSEYFNTIVAYCESADGKIDILQSQLNAIRSTAESLECTSSSGSCDCATVLGEISSKLTTINSSLVVVGTKLDNIYGASADEGLQAIINNLESINDRDEEVAQFFANWDGTFEDIYNWMEEIHTLLTSNLEDIFPLWLAILQKVDPDKVESALDNLSNNMGWGPVLDILTNRYYIAFFNLTGNPNTPIPNGAVNGSSYVFANHLPNSAANSFAFLYKSIYPGSTTAYRNSFEGLLRILGGTIPMSLSSLNNYAYIDWLDRTTNNVGRLLVDFTNQVANGFSAVTNTLERGFSIFANDSPLRGYADNDYYTYLTNYYISVSVNPSGSASEPYTNWFNRVEMLLAALVFKQETAKSNDFTTASTGSMENSLNGGLDQLRSIQENSSSVIQSVGKSSRSLISAMQGWNEKLSSAASLPSTIELVDLSVPSSTRDGGDSSSKIDLILSGGPLRSLCETTRAITTLCWCFVFLFSAWGLAKFMVLKFSGIIKFCYAVFKTALGIG